MSSRPTADATLDARSRVVACDQVLASPLGGEVVLLEPDAGVYYSLNEVGAFIWGRLQEPVSVEQLCHAVVGEFEVDLATCEPDIRAVLADLMRHRLVELVPDEGG